MQQSPEKKPLRRRDKFDDSVSNESSARRAARDNSSPRARKSTAERNMNDVRWDIDPPDKRG